MYLRVVTLFVLLSAFLQTMAMGASAVVLLDNDKTTAHAALHWQKKPHHHHHDGSVSQDHSDESVRHVFADGFPGGTAMPPTIALFFTQAEVTRPPMGDEPTRPWPHLDGLRRPPRLAA